MQLDAIVMSAFAIFIFLGYTVYGFYMFVTPTTRKRRLTAGWAFEPEQDLIMLHGLNIEEEIKNAMVAEIIKYQNPRFTR